MVNPQSEYEDARGAEPERGKPKCGNCGMEIDPKENLTTTNADGVEICDRCICSAKTADGFAELMGYNDAWDMAVSIEFMAKKLEKAREALKKCTK